MRGIAHFVTGVAVATCVPEAVRVAAAGNGIYLLLGGVVGLLPDLLDEKLNRFLFRHDVEITPDPLMPDPQMIADGIAAAYNESVYRGTPLRVRLNAIPVAPSRWQQVELYFDVMTQQIHVRYGPVVDEQQRPVEPAPKITPGVAQLNVPIELDYLARVRVDSPEGIAFEMRPTAAGSVIPLHAPWRRTWSHSLVLATVLALALTVATNVTAGIIALASWAAHIAQDKLGHEGMDLFYPFGTRRTTGLGIVDPQETTLNLFTIWFCALVIFWNLYRAAPAPPLGFSVIQMSFYGLLIPLFVTACLRRNSRKHP